MPCLLAAVCACVRESGCIRLCTSSHTAMSDCVCVRVRQVSLLMSSGETITLSGLEPLVLLHTSKGKGGTRGAQERTKQTLLQIFDSSEEAFLWFDSDSDCLVNATELKRGLQRLRVEPNDINTLVCSCYPPLPLTQHSFSTVFRWASPKASAGSSPAPKRRSNVDKKVQAWTARESEAVDIAAEPDVAQAAARLMLRWPQVCKACCDKAIHGGEQALSLEGLYSLLRPCAGGGGAGLSLPQTTRLYKASSPKKSSKKSSKK